MKTIFDGKLRVLDLSMGWAGPLAGQMFAEMGAEVIKVEDTEHFDWWRGSLSVAPPEMQPIERTSVFNTANRGKLGITLDLASTRGIEMLKRLIRVSDVLIENFSPRVMERLGLAYSAVRTLNPRMVMISMPSFGSDGPECEARGYGNTVEAMSGVTSLLAYHDAEQPYTMSNALGDPVSGLHSVFALMVALHERERTGNGQWIELAQVETLIPFVTGQMLEYQFTGDVPRPRGNRHPQHAPHGIYRCAGEEAWLALACQTEDQWRALAGELGHGLADDPRFVTASERKANEAALDAALADALKSIAVDGAVSRLSTAGVYAAPVNSAPAVMGDAQLQSREYFVAIDRAVVGTHLYPGAVARIPETPLDSSAPAPLLGEHNRKVFREVLGMSDTEIVELEEAGVIGNSPRVYRAAS